jgi:metal-responsive CopG/Arc/MetJ family transcriptional regulator
MSAKTRINITVDRETLRLADREARRRRISRSEVFRAAVHAEAARKDAADQQQDLLKQRQEAIEGIRRIAKQTGSWPAPKIVHDWRYRLAKEGH